MLLKELIRFSTQNRTLYCYLILSIWIFLLIAGMYKYIGNTRTIMNLNYINGKRMFLSTIVDDETSKLNKFKEQCSPIDYIIRKDDGGNLDGWKLQGVLLVIRHGDRGPMSHIRDINVIDCGVESDNLLNRYKQFLTNITNPSGTNHMFWNKIGPFHGFALLPPTLKSCLLGQLTFKGISQLLHIGEIMQHVYARPLGLFFKAPLRNNINSTPYSLLNSDEVVVYSTRYRRTFQSVMALLFSLLPQDKWLALNLHESHSMAFCFSECTCAQADKLRKRLLKLAQMQLERHASVTSVVNWIGQTLLQQHASMGSITNIHEIIDAVLTLVCHNASLPCRNILTSKTSSLNLYKTESSTSTDQNDVINIDQDDSPGASANQAIANPGIAMVAAAAEAIADMDDEAINNNLEGGCIDQSHIATLISYTNWQSKILSNHAYYKQIGLLRGYGLIRHIVSYMLKMISGDRTKFVLYSGHDWTMQYLTAALGINTETSFIPYAARLAIEVYRSDTQQPDFYFRVVYNGKDVTQQIDFCEGGKSLRVTRDNRHKADLCPIENIIRFIHDDYFTTLNATNFKDACMI